MKTQELLRKFALDVQEGMSDDQIGEQAEHLAKKIEELVRKEERQFIINVLDGIDIADKEMGLIGGTQAIRQRLPLSLLFFRELL